MKSPIDSRARFVETTAALLQRQGYHATGLKQIIEESGAPKGSLYFHFPGGKRSLAMAALEHSSEGMRAKLDVVARQISDPTQALRLIANALADELEASDFRDGCPVATVALEAAAQSPELQAVCSASYSAWQRLIESHLASAGVDEARVAPLANLILCTIEGALLLSRAHADATPLRSAGETLSALLARAVGPSSGSAGPPPSDSKDWAHWQ